MPTKTTQEYNRIIADYALYQHGEKREGRTDEEIISEHGGDKGWKAICDFENGWILTESRDRSTPSDSDYVVYTLIDSNNFENSYQAESLYAK